MMMLGDPEWSGWSNREIARRCRVDEATIRRCRESADTAEKPQYESGESPTFIHPKTGKPTTMNTANIGKRGGGVAEDAPEDSPPVKTMSDAERERDKIVGKIFAEVGMAMKRIEVFEGHLMPAEYTDPPDDVSILRLSRFLNAGRSTVLDRRVKVDRDKLKGKTLVKLRVGSIDGNQKIENT